MKTSRCRLVDNQPLQFEPSGASPAFDESEVSVFFILDLNNEKRWKIELYEDPITIGRSEASDLALEDSMVSGNHARLDFHQGSLRVTDLHSTNGTFVNEIRVSTHPLAHGDIIRCGGARLQVENNDRQRSLTQSKRCEDQTLDISPSNSLIDVYRPDGSLSGPAQQVLLNTIERAARKSVPVLILDLSKTTAISTNVIKLILRLRKRLQSKSGDLALCSMNQLVRDSFELSPDGRELKNSIYSDLDTARSSIIRQTFNK